jgi:hypothetical protein
MFHCHLLHHEDDGMMGTFLVIDPSTMGIEEQSSNVAVNVFPNPAKNSVRILLQGFDSNQPAVLKVSDAVGRTVLINEFNSNDHLINTSQWSAGVYIISLTQRNYSIHKKIIIEK